MDKNMIKIDDLVKQRLAGGEEQERPGAWLNMRDMLDDKMPTRPMGGFIWRRTLTYMAGLLLIGAVGAGGYAITANHSANLKTASATHGASGVMADAHTPAKNSVTTVKNSISNKLHSAINPAADGMDAGTRATSNNANHTSQTAKTSASNTLATNTTDKKHSTGTASANPSKGSTGLSTAASAARSGNTQKVASNEKAKKNENRTSKILPAASAGSIAKSDKLKDKMKKVAGITTVTKETDGNGEIATTGKKDGVDNAAKSSGQSNDNANKRNGLHNDSVNVDKITVEVNKEPGKPARLVQREENLGKVALNRPEPLDYHQTNPRYVDNVTQPANVPALVPPTKPANDDAGNTAMNGKPAKKKIERKSGGWDLGSFREAMGEIKYSLGHAQFAPGIKAGVNATFFGANSFAGFQFGFTGKMIFSDHWSTLMELLYFHRSNNGVNVNDNHIDYKNEGGGYYQKTTYQDVYSFSAMHSIELPIALNYNTSKFNMYAGGNLAYNFAVDALDNPETVSSVSVMSSTPLYTTSPSIMPADFRTRFSLAYILGVTYQFTHNVSLDLRMDRTFWDNSHSSGSRMLLNDLYKTPSFQFSIGYRLGSDSRVVSPIR